MLMLVDCSNCRTQLQLPPGAKSIRCALCLAVTRIAQPRDVVAPVHPSTYLTSTSSNNYDYHYHYQPPPPVQQPPISYAPPGQPASVNGQKRAVICGISYTGSRNQLKGCVNDANCMKYMLINNFKFPDSSIIMLTGTLLLLFHYSFRLIMYRSLLVLVKLDAMCGVIIIDKTLI